MKSKKSSSACPAFIIVLSILFFLPAFALSEETYLFERMWPAVQQPWYFHNPHAVALDKDGNVYVADTLNNRIQKFTSSGELVTKWGSSGEGDGQFWGPHGIAVDASGNVYVTDTENHRIQKFTSSGQYVTQWGSEGSGNGQFDFPHGIAVDGSGNVYVADTGNHRIQKFTSSGQYLTKWGSSGSGNGQFDNPHGIAVDGSGNVYVADELNYRIQKFTSSGQFVTKWGSEGIEDGQFDCPYGIAVDGSGNVYVADTYNNRIQKFTSSGQFLTKWGTLGSGNGQFDLPHGIAVDDNVNVYVADLSNERIQKFTSSGQFVTKWGSSGTGNGQFDNPQGIALDGGGNVYVADTLNYRIQKFTSSGHFVTQWGHEGGAVEELWTPAGIAVDGSGNVYVADIGNSCIQKFTSSGEFLIRWGDEGDGNGEFRYPQGVAVDGGGNVYVADTENHRIQKFTSTGTFIATWGTQGSGDGQFDWPYGIAVDGSGNVYVGDCENSRIQKFTSEGAFLTKWGTYGSGDGEFDYPHGVAIDGNGYVYVADTFENRVQKFTPDGELITKFGTSGSEPGNLNVPEGLCVNANGMLYVADTANHRIQVFRPSTAPPPGPEPPVGETREKAIIVAGGGPFAGNNLWDATQMLANYAYRALTYQGYTKDTLYYLTSDTGLDLDGNGIPDDVDADATNANLQYAITTWAGNASNLLIYMVDHGGAGTFRMGATELLYAADLDAWLDGIQQTIPGTVTLIYDACRSGSFLAALTPPEGKQRILATSASADQESIFGSQGTISFSFLFWARMFNGDSFYNSFYHAMNSIGVTYRQSPQLDGNGNGIGNEQEDLEAARGITIGNETLSAGDIPFIGSVSPSQTLNGSTSALIYAADVIDADGISRVWAVITPPGYSSADPDSPVTDLPILELTSTGGSRYEGTYSSFTTSGTYNIAVYAMDGGAVISLPKTTTVSQGAGAYLLYFPHVDTNLPWQTEIAVINTGDQSVTGTLRGYSDGGQAVGVGVEVSLSPGGRRQITVADEFTDHTTIGYIIFETDSDTVCGYTKFYKEGIYRTAIPAVKEINSSDIYVTHIDSGADWWTGISLVNTTPAQKDLTITFNVEGGTVLSKTITLGANGHDAFTIAQLFGQPQPEITSAVITNAGGVIGLELFGSQGDSGQLDGLLLTDDKTTTLYYPHIDSNGWWTGIVAYNPSDSESTITITPYKANGDQLTPLTDTLEGKEKYVGLVSSLGLPAETAWFRIDSTLPLSGFELFGTSDGSQLAAYAEGSGTGAPGGVFAKIEKNGGWTGIAFVNTEGSAATVTLTAYDDSGDPVAVEAILLDPYEKVVNMAEAIFSGQDIAGATYIGYSSTGNVVGFQLNGSADGTMLDGLPGM